MPQSDALLAMVPIELVAIAAMLTGAVWLVWQLCRVLRRRLCSSRIRLVALPSWPLAQTSAPDRVEELDIALVMAARLIERCTPYTPEAIQSAAAGLTIHVRPSAEWEISPGGLVARGQVDIPARSITVAPDLEALCHELGHLVEHEAVGRTDATHRTWPANGLFEASAMYHAWLAPVRRAREREAA